LDEQARRRAIGAGLMLETAPQSIRLKTPGRLFRH
jgi:hypothetical protein